LTLIALALAIFLPGGRQPDPDPKLPWDIRVDGVGGAEVFGLILQQSTLDQARQLFGAEGEVSLFVTQDGETTLEAYFERVFLNGLRADFVLVLDAGPGLLDRLYQRGSRISRTTERTRKVELAPQDLAGIGELTIRLINYIPAADLDESLLLQRFGEPVERIPETATGVTHWIYPQRGLSIGVNPAGKELLQYVQPRDIDNLIQVIKQSNEPAADRQ
jgi:hypothetical protein